MSSNKKAKERLIELYGKECWIDKLHLRPPEDKPKHYTGKNQLKKMKQLTYHHIKMKKDGGKATIENGALLSTENHQWFHKQSPEKQAEMNQKFQDYKKCSIEFTDDIQLPEGTEINFGAGAIDENGNFEVDPEEIKKMKKHKKQILREIEDKEAEEMIKEYYRGELE